MMSCEQCGCHLNGGSVTCQQCGHNHVLQRIDAWRERRNNHLAALRKSSKDKSTPNQSRTSAINSTLIRFPKERIPVPEPSPAESNIPEPEWKLRLNARLLEIREQRTGEVEPPLLARTTHKSSRNPIVEAALSRIDRANYLKPITPMPHSRYATAVELSPEPEPVKAPPQVTIIEERSVRVSYEIPRLEAEEPIIEIAEELQDQPEFAYDEDDILDLPPEVHFGPDSSQTASLDHQPGFPTFLDPATLNKRLAAAVIDAEIIAISLLPLFAAYAFLGGDFSFSSLVMLALLGMGLAFIYFFVNYALACRTVGMARLELHLASQSASEEAMKSNTPSTITITFRQALLRAFGSAFSLLFFLINMIFIARNDDRLSIADQLSDTLVVMIRK